MGDDVSMQLPCYAPYAMEKWGCDFERVKLVLYNLLTKSGDKIFRYSSRY
jgi:hypothetical protein